MNKILNAINSLKDTVMSKLQILDNALEYSRKKHDNSIVELSNTVQYQAELMNTMLNHLYENDKTLDTVVFIPYRGKPVVYKDGKLISTDLMTRFAVDWSYDSRTEVTVDNN